MNFKKFLALVCSFLLVLSGFVTGNSVGAKHISDHNACVFMVNSGEDIGGGTLDGDEHDKACFNTCIGNVGGRILNCGGAGFKDTLNSESIFYRFIYLNPACPEVEMAMKFITMDQVPEVFVVVANLAKNKNKVKADINRHFDQILHCQQKSSLYSGNCFYERCDFSSKNSFSYEGKLKNNEVYLDTVPVVIYGVVPEGMNQITSNETFMQIAREIKVERQGRGERDGKFKHIHNEVCIAQKNKTHICINMDNAGNKSDRNITVITNKVATDDNMKPILWPDYHSTELPRRAEQYWRKEKERKKKNVRKKERKEKLKKGRCRNRKIGVGAVGLTLATIFGRNHHKNKNKTKVPKAQENQVKNQAKTQVLESTAAV